MQSKQSKQHKTFSFFFDCFPTQSLACCVSTVTIRNTVGICNFIEFSSTQLWFYQIITKKIVHLGRKFRSVQGLLENFQTLFFTQQTGQFSFTKKGFHAHKTNIFDFAITADNNYNSIFSLSLNIKLNIRECQCSFTLSATVCIV